MGYSCPVTWKFTSRHRWAGLALSVFLLCGSYLPSAFSCPVSWVRHALSHFLSCVWLRSSSCHSVTDSRGRLTLICIKQHPFSSLKSVLLLSSWVIDAFVFTHLLSLHTYRFYSCFYFQKTRSIYLLNFHNLLLPLYYTIFVCICVWEIMPHMTYSMSRVLFLFLYFLRASYKSPCAPDSQ